MLVLSSPKVCDSMDNVEHCFVVSFVCVFSQSCVSLCSLFFCPIASVMRHHAKWELSGKLDSFFSALQHFGPKVKENVMKFIKLDSKGNIREADANDNGDLSGFIVAPRNGDKDSGEDDYVESSGEDDDEESSGEDDDE
jgi:hypothetical protein